MLFILLTLTLALAADEPPPPAFPAVPSIEKIDGGKIVFTNASLKTKLSAIEPLGLLNAKDDARPYLLVSALPCEDCATDKKALYLLRIDGTSQNKFVYPGEIRDRKDGQVLFRSRSFFGQCLPGKPDVYIVFQSEKVDRRRALQDSVFIAEVGPVRIDEKLLWRGKPSLTNVLKLVKKKTCQEIKGFARKSGEFQLPSKAKAEAGEGPSS
jgi:hypothetical protein